MILVVDFGSQTAHLIGRRVRELGVGVEYVDPEEVLEKVDEFKPNGLIFSGGPASVYADDAHGIDVKVFGLGLPILGICYGWQLMARDLGGEVKSHGKEYGPENVIVKSSKGILPEGVDKFSAVMSHGDSVTKLPKGFSVCAKTRGVVFAGVENAKKKFFGLQFHPEVEHTEHGKEILKKFVGEVCGEDLSPVLLDPGKIVAEIQIKVRDRKVIFAVSGGVDSTVSAFLTGKAVGKNLIPVYVESGLMRQGTEKLVKYIFSDLVKSDLVIVQAKDRFMSALKGVTDPEVKRKTIGKLYVDIFTEEAAKHPEADFLGQGTIYSDVIESKGSKKASKIKSHHNVGGLPDNMELELLEPMRNYYKDEVRELGRMAELPEEVVQQQPFPGPGYAVRIRGEVTEFRLEQVRIADLIVVEEMKRSGMYERVFQCFAVMTGAYSTAVKGDSRAFAEVVAVRAYESSDVMTSQWADIPHQVLAKISSRIVNEVSDVSRVVYDITTKPPATMEWE